MRFLTSRTPRAPALDPGEGLSTPAGGTDTYIEPTSSMRSVMTLSEYVVLTHEELVLYRELFANETSCSRAVCYVKDVYQ